MNLAKQFREEVIANNPLPILGVIDAYSAKLAQCAGAKAIYLSGAGVANAQFGLPDLAMTTMSEVVSAAQKITQAVSLPLLVDIDTGFGSILNIERTIQLMEGLGVAAVQIEDQPYTKRCGHRDGKQVIPTAAMCARIYAASQARQANDFVIMARTDALSIESSEAVLERVSKYIEHGADMIFLEAVKNTDDLIYISSNISVPLLINSTEFGKTPIKNMNYWHAHGAQMVLYPLSAFRAAAKASLQVYETILSTGSQEGVLANMQTRQELYEVLNYQYYEDKISKNLVLEGIE